jgi:hypothetical protein
MVGFETPAEPWLNTHKGNFMDADCKHRKLSPINAILTCELTPPAVPKGR